MSHQTLFLQQSYIDCTNQYTTLLEAPNIPLWDYVVLTASNEEQAESYRTQIKYRLEHHMLPASTHYAGSSRPGRKAGWKRRCYLECIALYPSACRIFSE